MRQTSSRLLFGLLILSFLVLLFWVEQSPWSDRAVARLNDGYGTFDMKLYDVTTVQNVLAKTKPEGFSISYRDYIGDGLLILCVGCLQYLISNRLYRAVWQIHPVIRALYVSSVVVLVLRGIAAGIVIRLVQRNNSAKIVEP